MWNFLPRLMPPVTFLVFLQSGHEIGFSGLMQVIMLLGRIEGPLHHINGMQG
jgi:hypothetical protein